MGKIMQQLIEFISSHGWLFTIFAIIVVLVIMNEVHGAVKGVKKCSAAIVTRLINQENAQLVDVRDKAEFKTGYITGSVNIPMGELALKAPTLDKARPIVVVCKLGQRAQTAAALLKQQGYSNVVVLSGGLAAWRNEGLPLITR